MNRRLVLPSEFRQRMIDHALAGPNECVGLLAGRGGSVEAIYPLTNEAKSPTRFFAAESLFRPMREMRETGLELVAIYHSHPASPPIPSRLDIEENYYPDAFHVIVSLQQEEPQLRAWLLSTDDAEEVEIVDSTVVVA